MKVLASDYDGTIRVGKWNSYRNIKAIKRWRQEGNIFGVVTGRTIDSIRKELQKANIEVDFLIGNNGAVVIDGNGDVIGKEFAKFDVCMDLIEDMKTKDIKACVISNGFQRALVFTKPGFAIQLFGTWSKSFTFEDAKQQKEIAQVILAALGKEDKNRELAKYINEKYGDDLCAYSNRSCIDVVVKEVNKATGIKMVEKALQVKSSDINTIGDSFNDVPMLEMYSSATLKHAHPEIQKIAGEVVKDVAAYIEKLETT